MARTAWRDSCERIDRLFDIGNRFSSEIDKEDIKRIARIIALMLQLRDYPEPWPEVHAYWIDKLFLKYEPLWKRICQDEAEKRRLQEAKKLEKAEQLLLI